ncbi:hypothetical protein B0H16DRAFT_1607075 [Mycena metata]|uniref:Secreted protein n=1 Tax=Mycena metata TaxID=1033252 RepID=A0AAD7HF27_9AGAR|nr:hypothetical protein B0H16DRAFT_1607075 [Mycena metata]
MYISFCFFFAAFFLDSFPLLHRSPQRTYSAPICRSGSLHRPQRHRHLPQNGMHARILLDFSLSLTPTVPPSRFRIAISLELFASSSTTIHRISANSTSRAFNSLRPPQL